MMSDSVRSFDDSEEQRIAALFAQRLVDEPMPAALLDRLTLAVLDEVQFTLPLATSPAQLAPGSAPTSVRRTLRLALESLRRRLRRLSPKQSLLLAGAAAAAAMLLFVGISRITPRPLTALAAVSGGDATVLSANTNRFHIQHDGDQIKLRAGDQVLTDDGSVQLAHFPGHVTVIEPGSHVEVTDLGDADGGLQLALTVHDGVVHSTLNTPLRANDHYTIHTPVVAVSAVGTDFTVETITEAETLVTAYTGSVAITMGEQTIMIGPGQEVDAIAGQALAAQPAGSD